MFGKFWFLLDIYIIKFAEYDFYKKLKSDQNRGIRLEKIISENREKYEVLHERELRKNFQEILLKNTGNLKKNI